MAPRKPSKKYEAIVKAHQPRGYMLRLQKMNGATAGIAQFVREIRVEKLEDRNDLFIYLHEVGHVRNGHCRSKSNSLPDWRVEYEADQYAIKAMRDAGISVPRDTLNWHKSLVRDLVDADHRRGNEVDDTDVLKYAFGKNWREQLTSD